MAGRVTGCGGIANVHADHVGKTALWDMMWNVEGHVSGWELKVGQMIPEKERTGLG